MKPKNGITGLLAALVLMAAVSMPRYSFGGYLSTEDYLKMDNDSKIAYIMGMADMMHFAAVVSGKEEDIGFIEKCFTGRNTGELRRLLDSYMAEHKDAGQYDITSNFAAVLEEKCR